MKKFIILFLVFAGVIIWGINLSMPADAAKSSKAKGGLGEKQITEINENVDNLTKKYYMRELYSPKDSENLIYAKMQVDSQMDVAPDPSLAPIYFKLGNLFKLREMNPESIDCYQTILENFSDTVYAPKARKILIDMGVEIKESLPTDEENDEEAF